MYIDAAGVRARLPMLTAIDALETALRAAPVLPVPARSSVAAGAGELRLMPAAGAGGAAGVKLVTLQPDNPARGLPFVQGMYVLFAAGTLTPAAAIDGGELTTIRTAAVSGLATRHLAVADASRLVVFGTGVQARSHIEAMRAVRPVAQIIVVGRRADSAGPLVAELRAAGLQATAGTPRDVAEADLVCCCTTASEPLFDGALLRPGAHVNAIGSYQPHTREIDTPTVTRSLFVVDDRAAVLEEAGDVRIPIAEGAFGPDRIAADLQSVVAGPPLRQADSDITVFKSVGVAWQDLILAETVAGA